MPDGLIFKVQIGAFKNPIPQDLFKGIKPITAETTPQGLMRYTAGIFDKFNTANNANSQVTDLGYRDAFVVAFFNGKRISMAEALAKANEAGQNIENPGAISNNSNTGSTVNNSANITSGSSSSSSSTLSGSSSSSGSVSSASGTRFA